MRQLMISLDSDILHKESMVSRRMVQYGQKNELFIVVPARIKKQIDLSPTVHVTSVIGNKILQFFRILRVAKSICRLNIVESITAQDPFFIGLIGVFLKIKYKIPLEIQFHGDFFSKYYEKQYFRQRLIRFVLQKADVIRVPGERVKQSLIIHKIPVNKIVVYSVQNDPEVISNWTATSSIRNNYPGFDKYFLVLGRLDPVKNITWLINVFKEVVKIKNCLLLIVGKGAQENVIKRSIISERIENNVKVLNWVDDPYSYLKSADCLLFPSLSESYGLAPVEASILGTPIIMSDVGVANYELKPGPKVTILPLEKEKWVEAILKV